MTKSPSALPLLPLGHETVVDWRRTLDSLEECISIIGRDYVIQLANTALARLVGKDPRELIGESCFRALHGMSDPCARCPVGQVLATGKAVRVDRESFRANRTFDYHAFPLKDPGGQITGVIVHGRDVTQEEQRRKSVLQSERLRTVGQIAAGIAHEINNPLTVVSSYAQLLGMGLTDPKDAESIRQIEDGIARIHRLVQNLTSFLGPSEDHFYPLDLSQIVVDILSFSRYDLTRGEARLTLELGQSLPKVLGSREQLEQVVVSLLTNARDALGGRGTITVRTRAQDEHVIVQVEDDGVGICPDDATRIFEPFYTTKTRGKGMGLGLFMAAGIARKHRGEIAVESEPGQGSRFTLSLPAFHP